MNSTENRVSMSFFFLYLATLVAYYMKLVKIGEMRVVCIALHRVPSSQTYVCVQGSRHNRSACNSNRAQTDTSVDRFLTGEYRYDACDPCSRQNPLTKSNRNTLFYAKFLYKLYLFIYFFLYNI